jgi:hypothetical protein
MWKSNRFIHSVLQIPTLMNLSSWIGVRQLLDLQSSGGVKLPNYNPVMIIRSYILYSFSLNEFSLMVSHKRFLMRRYKYKCLDMSHCFLLIFSLLGFKGVFGGTSYCTFCNIYMSYLLFSPLGFLKEVYKAYLLFSKLIREVFPFSKVFSYEFSWRQQSLHVVLFSPYFSQRV